MSFPLSPSSPVQSSETDAPNQPGGAADDDGGLGSGRDRREEATIRVSRRASSGVFQVNIPNAPNSNFRAGVFYATDPNAYAPHAPLGDIVLPDGVDGIDTEWSVAASYRHQFDPAFSGVLGGQYFEDFHGDNSFLIQSAVVRVPVADQAEI